MSNARIRAYLQSLSAPIVAWLIDNGYVYDDCGMLNAYRSSIREGVLVASRTLQNMTPVPLPLRCDDVVDTRVPVRMRERL